MIKVNAIGDQCPIPIVKTKEAIKGLNGSGTVETAVDNKIAVENLQKFAAQNGYGFSFTEDGANFKTVIAVGENVPAANECTECQPDIIEYGTVVVISSSEMGNGDETLGRVLMKGFIFALSKAETLPETILFYNSGAFLTAEGSESLEDISAMESEGVEILTCGTCINHYGLNEKPPVGTVTNMYSIAEKMTGAKKLVKP